MRANLLLSIAVVPLLAQDGADTQLQTRPTVLQLSLRKAVELALAPEGSTRVQLAEEALKQAKSREQQARAGLLPDLEGYVSDKSETENLRALGLNFSTPLFQIPTLIGPFDVFDVRATVNQTVFDFSTIRRFQASKVAVDAAKGDNDSTRNQVTDQVARAYLTALRADAALATAKANVDLSEALLKLARSQKAAGTGTGIEITRAQVQLANDRQRLLVADNDRERAHLQLLKTVGLKLENPVELTDKLGYVPIDPIEEQKAIAVAHQTRAELKAQHSKEENAKLNYSATKWERLPSLSAAADYGSIGASINNALPTRTYGVTLRVPLFDGGRRDARRAESASLYRQERIRTADLKDQIELDVRTALDSLRSADAQVKAANEGLGSLRTSSRRPGAATRQALPTASR